MDSCDESEDEAMSSFIASNSPSDKNHSNRKRKGVNAMTLNPGDWISYINRMFGTIVYTRIVWRSNQPRMLMEGNANSA